MTEISKAYDPKEVEERIYKHWESSGYFSPDKNSSDQKFVIVIPPPNVTGSLHMGHALDNTLQDILVRFKRMRGFKTLWVPGTDHAGIATQNVVEKQLKKDGKKKEDIGRENFVKMVWEWKKQYGGTITKQLRRLGASCDWSRERFTMDEGLSKAVRKAFVTLYKEGLIYKGKRMVNWCPRCGTAISDIEVEHESKKGHLWSLKYYFKGSKDFIVVATTRPETMLGDTAVAVNPEDERYKDLIGKKLILPLVNREIPIVADSFVDPAFGTGAVKVTPAHDPNDFEISQRHNLPLVNIFTKDARITLEEFNSEEKTLINKYEHLDRAKAREAVLKDLEEGGFLLETKDYENNIGKCYRCKTDIEPYLSDQWFVKVSELAKTAMAAVSSGDIEYIPQRWTKVYLDWMENLRDWCISRQIWWGHRIPVWYCACGEIIVSEEDPKKCPSCGNSKLEQDSDVLDTWFSSSLWPFSTLGWPQDTKDFKEFYPTSVLITGYDIITFWVSKMIMMGLKFMGKKPFSKIYIHGLIRDLTGKKMSKSLGNVIDPTEVIDRVGADALRFSLTSLVTSGGQDLKLSEEKIIEGRNFANKIWNVARFVMMQGDVKEGDLDKSLLSPADKWILDRFNTTIKQITDNLDNFEFGEAARRLYEFIWSEFCDWYVELSKQNLYQNPNPPKADQIPNPPRYHSGQAKQIPSTNLQNMERQKENTLKILHKVLTGTLKLLHPFMPFETEEIFHNLGNEKTIMLEPWPMSDETFLNTEAVKKIGLTIEIIRAIRNIRAEMEVPQNANIKLIISAGNMKDIINESLLYIQNLSKAESVEVYGSIKTKPLKSVSAVVSGIEIYVPLEGLIDFNKEIERLKKAKAETESLIERTNAKLSNHDFISRAKPELVEGERAKLEEYRSKLKIISDRIKILYA